MKKSLIDPTKDKKFAEWLEDVQFEARQIIPTISLASLEKWPYSNSYRAGLPAKDAAMATIVNSCVARDRRRWEMEERGEALRNLDRVATGRK